MNLGLIVNSMEKIENLIKKIVVNYIKNNSIKDINLIIEIIINSREIYTSIIKIENDIDYCKDFLKEINLIEKGYIETNKMINNSQKKSVLLELKKIQEEKLLKIEDSLSIKIKKEASFEERFFIYRDVIKNEMEEKKKIKKDIFKAILEIKNRLQNKQKSVFEIEDKNTSSKLKLREEEETQKNHSKNNINKIFSFIKEKKQ